MISSTRIFFIFMVAALFGGCAAESEPDISASRPREQGAANAVPTTSVLDANGQVEWVNETTAVPVSEIWASELSVLAALSPEEASWLNRNGFPTSDDLARVPYMDEERLSAEMHAGSGLAAALLAHKRMLTEDFRGASSAFARGAQLGSLYAREQHAILELIRTSDVEDGRIIASPAGHKAVLVARMEVARMLGDHRVDHYLRKYASDVNREIYADDILAMATEFMRQYGMTESPRPPDPRPNAELWASIEATDSSRSVLVYNRQSFSQ